GRKLRSGDRPGDDVQSGDSL
ncbi:MAG: Glycerol kinase, partial [uncultured Rubrobacteraceae bacterium]